MRRSSRSTAVLGAGGVLLHAGSAGGRCLGGGAPGPGEAGVVSADHGPPVARPEAAPGSSHPADLGSSVARRGGPPGGRGGAQEVDPRFPLRRLTLSALSVADDVSFVALHDVTEISQWRIEHRLIGAHIVTLHAYRWGLGAELYRETRDVDLGIPLELAKDPAIVERLEALGYRRSAGQPVHPSGYRHPRAGGGRGRSARARGSHRHPDPRLHELCAPEPACRRSPHNHRDSGPCRCAGSTTG